MPNDFNIQDLMTPGRDLYSAPYAPPADSFVAPAPELPLGAPTIETADLGYRFSGTVPSAPPDYLAAAENTRARQEAMLAGPVYPESERFARSIAQPKFEWQRPMDLGLPLGLEPLLTNSLPFSDFGTYGQLLAGLDASPTQQPTDVLGGWRSSMDAMEAETRYQWEQRGGDYPYGAYRRDYATEFGGALNSEWLPIQRLGSNSGEAAAFFGQGDFFSPTTRLSSLAGGSAARMSMYIPEEQSLLNPLRAPNSLETGGRVPTNQGTPALATAAGLTPQVAPVAPTLATPAQAAVATTAKILATVAPEISGQREALENILRNGTPQEQADVVYGQIDHSQILNSKDNGYSAYVAAAAKQGDPVLSKEAYEAAIVAPAAKKATSELYQGIVEKAKGFRGPADVTEYIAEVRSQFKGLPATTMQELQTRATNIGTQQRGSELADSTGLSQAAIDGMSVRDLLKLRDGGALIKLNATLQQGGVSGADAFPRARDAAISLVNDRISTALGAEAITDLSVDSLGKRRLFEAFRAGQTPMSESMTKSSFYIASEKSDFLRDVESLRTNEGPITREEAASMRSALAARGASFSERMARAATATDNGFLFPKNPNTGESLPVNWGNALLLASAGLSAYGALVQQPQAAKSMQDFEMKVAKLRMKYEDKIFARNASLSTSLANISASSSRPLRGTPSKPAPVRL